jgi:hypothetical protein
VPAHRRLGTPAGDRAETDPGPVGTGAQAVTDTSSPSSRKVRGRPVGQGHRLGAVPGQLEEGAALLALRPDTVPDANRSPVRSEAPLT